MVGEVKAGQPLQTNRSVRMSQAGMRKPASPIEFNSKVVPRFLARLDLRGKAIFCRIASIVAAIPVRVLRSFDGPTFDPSREIKVL